MKIDHQKVSDVIREVAADKIAPRFRQLKKSEVRAKSGPNDLVTVADEEAEIELTRILPTILPGSLVLGEEAVSSGKVLRDVLKQSEYPVWIVDPVDGTNNFAHGKEVFGTMVCLIDKGERVASWIYQIPRERLISCEKGAGIRIDGAAFQPPARPEEGAPFSELSALVSRKFMPPKIGPYVGDKIGMLKEADSYWCCAWDYIELLEGRAAFSVYNRIEPWDHMAGVLMLEEAGLHVRKWDWSVYGGADLDGGLISAASEGLWRRVYDEFLKEPLEALKKG
ncbi:MAG TPA: inositol monophosphatase [Micavibrio sp.]|nr:inositol monophosphatase [Micavibrio sp.]